VNNIFIVCYKFSIHTGRTSAMIFASTVRESVMRVLILLCTGLLLGGCAGSSATVVKPSGGPSIAAAQAAPAQGPQRRIAVSGFDARAGGGA
jgi:uncharacterized lipoprotein YajG